MSAVPWWVSGMVALLATLAVTTAVQWWLMPRLLQPMPHDPDHPLVDIYFGVYHRALDVRRADRSGDAAEFDAAVNALRAAAARAVFAPRAVGEATAAVVDAAVRWQPHRGSDPGDSPARLSAASAHADRVGVLIAAVRWDLGVPGARRRSRLPAELLPW